jgi:hypothetical protein
MALHPDFVDLLAAFAEEKVEIGGYAVAFHRRPRFTKEAELKAVRFCGTSAEQRISVRYQRGARLAPLFPSLRIDRGFMSPPINSPTAECANCRGSCPPPVMKRVFPQETERTMHRKEY